MSENQFVLRRIYIKDASFESPQSPKGFVTQWEPKINLDLNTRHTEIEKNLYEVVLHVTVTAKTGEDIVMYLVEVQQAGIFLVQGMEEEAKKQTLGSYCPNLLFPYAREAVDNLVLKGSFPPLMLGPVNFESIYHQIEAEKARHQNQIQ